MSEPVDEPEAAPPRFRIRPAFDFDQMKELVARHFKVYESERDVRGVPGSEIAAFYVQADPAEFNRRFEALRADVASLDPSLVVVLQYRAGEDIILIARKPPVVERGYGLNLLLLVLTVLTTTLAGAFSYAFYEQAKDLLTIAGVDATFLHPRFLALGFLSFSLPLMLILGIHELGHYFVAKRHRVRTSLPYFIPVPLLVPIGTFGAFISIRDPIPDRKALFDIGAAGPLAGFVATLPVLFVGLLLTSGLAHAVPPQEEIHAELLAPDGAAWGHGHSNGDAAYANTTKKTKGEQDEYQETIRLSGPALNHTGGPWTLRVRPVFLENSTQVSVRIQYHVEANHTPTSPFQSVGQGNYSFELADRSINATEEAVVSFSVPPDADALEAGFFWKRPDPPYDALGSSLLFWGASYLVPTSENVLMHPTAFAGWVGLLVTGFNLLPAGQLDGGHVARAVLGDRMKWASWASLGVMLLLAYWFLGWLVMAVVLLFLGIQHPPPLNDRAPLDPGRKLLAVVVAAILVLTFVPIPWIDL